VQVITDVLKDDYTGVPDDLMWIETPLASSCFKTRLLGPQSPLAGYSSGKANGRSTSLFKNVECPQEWASLDF
jgi:hypothetical protein